MVTKKIFLLSSLLGGILFLALCYGFIISEFKIFPYAYFDKVKSRIVKVLPDTDEGLHSYSRPSVFVNLQGNSVKVPVTRKGDGGGLTTMRDSVILITHEGGIFSATATDDLRRTAIQPPENYFEDYLSVAAQPPYDSYQHRPDRFRYNDILYYSTASESGLLVSYTKFDRTGTCYTNAISKLVFIEQADDIGSIEATAADWELFYESKPCLPLKIEYRAIEGHMAGGRMVFDGKQTIYYANGEYHWDGVYASKAIAQDADYEYGKVVSISLSDGEYEVLTSGQRNMQGIVLDRHNQLWTVEHGIRGGDELNLIQQGKDYGFPSETLGTLYSGLPVPNTVSYGRHETFEKPIWAWLPSIGISSLAYVNDFHESWDGDLLAGSLRDGALHRIRITDKRALFAERISIGSRIRYVQMHREKTIVLWTDDKRLHFIKADNNASTIRFVKYFIEKKEYSDGLDKRIWNVIGACNECHSFDSTDSNSAPSLSLVYKSKAGASPYEGYSKSMQNADLVWDRENLIQFLSDPLHLVPGTHMPNPNISDQRVIEGVVDLIEALQKSAKNWDKGQEY